jgi:hypothetical protein
MDRLIGAILPRPHQFPRVAADDHDGENHEDDDHQRGRHVDPDRCRRIVSDSGKFAGNPRFHVDENVAEDLPKLVHGLPAAIALDDRQRIGEPPGLRQLDRFGQFGHFRVGENRQPVHVPSYALGKPRFFQPPQRVGDARPPGLVWGKIIPVEGEKVTPLAGFRIENLVEQLGGQVAELAQIGNGLRTQRRLARQPQRGRDDQAERDEAADQERQRAPYQNAEIGHACFVGRASLT